MRILFMGTPDFAAASLKAMTDAGLDVVGVVSQPDRPKGRGHKLVPTDVKAAALEAGIENIYQPEKLRNGELQPQLYKNGRISRENAVIYSSNSELMGKKLNRI